MIAFLRSVAGLWFGLWFIAGTALWVGGVLILAIQCYGWLLIDVWFPVTLRGITRLLAITVPAVSWVEMQKAIDWVLLLPTSGVFILCGSQIALMALIAKKNMEMRCSNLPAVVAVKSHHPLNDFGITTLHIHGR
jgi:hypothetical protein